LLLLPRACLLTELCEGRRLCCGGGEERRRTKNKRRKERNHEQEEGARSPGHSLPTAAAPPPDHLPSSQRFAGRGEDERVAASRTKATHVSSNPLVHIQPSSTPSSFSLPSPPPPAPIAMVTVSLSTSYLSFLFCPVQSSDLDHSSKPPHPFPPNNQTIQPHRIIVSVTYEHFLTHHLRANLYFPLHRLSGFADPLSTALRWATKG
jgi:hypothetical protein